MNPIQGGAPSSYAAAPAAANNVGMPRNPHQFIELLDHLRAEYENLLNENKTFRGLREEYQRKVEEHVSELENMESALLDLDRKHHAMKDQYEAEINRLKGQQGGIPTSSAGPAGAPGQTAVKRPPGVVGASAGGPDTSAQMSPYQSSLPAVFGQAGAGGQPSAIPQQGAQGNVNQPGKFTPRSMVPAPSQAQPPGRLMGIPSLPSAAPAPSGMHAPGRVNSVIPGLTPGGPVVSRAPPGKMHSIGMIPSTANAPASEVTPLSHQLKKETAPAVGHASIVGTSTGPGAFGPGNPRQPNVPTSGPFNAMRQPAQEEDWFVFPESGANGTMVNMKVDLQNSFTHDSVVCCVRYSWDGQYLATGSNRSAQIFDAASGQSVAVFAKDDGGEMDDGAGQDSYVRAVCFSPDGNWLITGAEDHVVKVWDVRHRTVKHKLIGHDTDIYSVDASANSHFIISGSGDKKAKLWSLETGKLLSTLGEEYGPTDGITSVSVSPTSQHVAAGSLDKIVRVWDVESSRLVRQFEGHRDSVYSVAFSPDGRMLLSGSLDKSLKLWDLAASQPSSQCRLSFTGHKDFVLSVAFSPNGRWLISGSKDRTVQFWDPRQSTMCLQLQGHKNSVISIAHNPRTRSLATGSGDCRARTWTYT